MKAIEAVRAGSGKTGRTKKGSMTVEACIVLPLFLCVIISIIFLIKVIYTHELIQHAVNETAGEIASTAYIYQASGIRTIHDTAQSRVNSSTDGFKEKADTIFAALKSLGGDESMPLEQFETAAGYIAGGAFEDAKTELVTPFTRLIMTKYIAEGSEDSADARLKALNVKGGLAGMDFSRSRYLCDEEENIEIVVSYEVTLPVPIKILPELKIVQKAVVKAWLSGDEKPETAENQAEDDSIWLLGNLERGARIRNIFGANLPFSFPVIARFDSGKAVMIKSMDLTAESYQNTFNLSVKLDEYIKELARYKGQETPWGSKKIVIRGKDISCRQLLLVIPCDELLPAIEEKLREYEYIARSRGIELKIERYGTKASQAEKKENDENNVNNVKR